MNNKQKQDLISYRISRAKLTLTEVELLITNGMYNSAMNRLYYACFYAITALLINDGIEARKHSGVKQMFGLHFILTGKIKDEYGKFYAELFNKRQAGDYDDFVEFKKEDILPLIEPANELITQIEFMLRK